MAGPLSQLYVTNWHNGGIAVIQGNQIIRSWGTAGSGEISIAVTDTVKTFGYNYPSYTVGAQYTLSGTYTGTQYVKGNNGATYTHDGTTNGIYNFTVDYSSGGVYRYDSNWTNPYLMFTTGSSTELSITYDPTNNSFWVGHWGNGTIRNFSYTGSLLSTISTPYAHIGALALDHADGTLWFTNAGGNTFYQYSKSGTQLSSVAISGLSGSVYGAEFAYSVPEPASLFFLGIGLIACFGILRRKL